MKTMKICTEFSLSGKLPGFGNYTLDPGVFYNVPDDLAKQVKKTGVTNIQIEGGITPEAIDLAFTPEEPELPAHETDTTDPDDTTPPTGD